MVVNFKVLGIMPGDVECFDLMLKNFKSLVLKRIRIYIHAMLVKLLLGW